MEKLGKSFIHPSQHIEVLSSFEDPLFKQQVEWNVRQVSNYLKNFVEKRSKITHVTCVILGKWKEQKGSTNRKFRLSLRCFQKSFNNSYQ